MPSRRIRARIRWIPNPRGVGTGQGETGQGADQERREHDREQRAEHVATSLPQREARPVSDRVK
jgi:hypothetical protein